MEMSVDSGANILGRRGYGKMDEYIDRIFETCDLVPAIVQDADTHEVLMLAYMNRESFIKTLETGKTWFFSRSRGKLWNKGETSGISKALCLYFLTVTGTRCLW